MKRLIDSFIQYATAPAFLDAILAWRVPSFPYSAEGLVFWSEEQWWNLTTEVVDAIKSQAGLPNQLYNYIVPILDRLHGVSEEIFPEPESFWNQPAEYACSAEGGRSVTPESDADRVVWRLRNDLHRLGAIIQSALLESNQGKDLFFYQDESHSELLSCIRTYDIASVRHWGYLHTLKLTKGIRLQPVDILYWPVQRAKTIEFYRNLCIQANLCDVDEINSFFRSVAECFKNATLFDKSAFIGQCDSLRQHCLDIANSQYTLLEKTIFVTSLLGTLSLCWNPSMPKSRVPEGVKEVYDRFLEIIDDVFTHCDEALCFRDLCKELGIVNCPIVGEDNGPTNMPNKEQLGKTLLEDIVEEQKFKSEVERFHHYLNISGVERASLLIYALFMAYRVTEDGDLSISNTEELRKYAYKPQGILEDYPGWDALREEIVREITDRLSDSRRLKTYLQGLIIPLQRFSVGEEAPIEYRIARSITSVSCLFHLGLTIRNIPPLLAVTWMRNTEGVVVEESALSGNKFKELYPDAEKRFQKAMAGIHLITCVPRARTAFRALDSYCTLIESVLLENKAKYDLFYYFNLFGVQLTRYIDTTNFEDLRGWTPQYARIVSQDIRFLFADNPFSGNYSRRKDLCSFESVNSLYYQAIEPVHKGLILTDSELKRIEIHGKTVLKGELEDLLDSGKSDDEVKAEIIRILGTLHICNLSEYNDLTGIVRYYLTEIRDALLQSSRQICMNAFFLDLKYKELAPKDFPPIVDAEVLLYRQKQICMRCIRKKCTYRISEIDGYKEITREELIELSQEFMDALLEDGFLNDDYTWKGLHYLAAYAANIISNNTADKRVTSAALERVFHLYNLSKQTSKDCFHTRNLKPIYDCFNKRGLPCETTLIILDPPNSKG